MYLGKNSFTSNRMTEIPTSLTRRQFLRITASVAASSYIPRSSFTRHYLETPSEPDDSAFPYQRPLFENMHVLGAFDLEDKLVNQGTISLSPANTVTIGFLDIFAITRIPGEFPAVPGWDAVSKKPIPDDGLYELDSSGNQFSHATRLASIAISYINNRVGIAGLCGKIPVTVKQVKLLNREPPHITMDTYQAALKYFINNPVDVLNISVGSMKNSPDHISDINYLIKERKTIVVAAAGNNNSDKPEYPAAYPGVISVRAITLPDNQRWEHSNYGKVDMAGYGLDVPTLQPLSSEDRRPALILSQGTTAAYPQVSSLAVHLRYLDQYKHRGSSAEEVLKIMRETGTLVAGPNEWILPNYEAAIKSFLAGSNN